jgi:hypothetical protein
MRTVLLTLACLLSVPLHASDNPAPLTQVETLRIENSRLESVIIQRELDDWRARRATLKADLEGARPGWVWNSETGAFSKAPAK